MVEVGVEINEVFIYTLTVDENLIESAVRVKASEIAGTWETVEYFSLDGYYHGILQSQKGE